MVWAVIFLAGCSEGSGPRRTVGPPPSGGPAEVFVAVGSSETVGTGADDQLRDAWPQVFYRTALPTNAVFVNLAIPRATTEDVLSKEVPQAEALSPTLVAVWVNVDDLLAGVAVEDYEARLGEIVRRLRQGGAAEVLIATAPAVHTLPALVACPAPPEAPEDSDTPLEGPASPGSCEARPSDVPLDTLAQAVAAYNDATARVAAAEGAMVVDVGTEGRGRDGLHPDADGHRRVAAAFAAAHERAR